MTNEKPGGHGERSVAVGTLDMAIWDATAKIAGKPLFRMLAEQKGREANPRVFVYAAGGYYYPGKDYGALRAEMRGYLDRGYTVVKMKIGGADDRRGPAPHRGRAERDRLAGAARRRRQRSLRSGDRHRLRQDAPAISAVLVRGSRRSPRLCVAGGAVGILSGRDGDGRKPVLAPGRPQPVALRRHAARPRLAAIRLRTVLRPRGIPAHAQRAASIWLVAVALHPARRPPDVAEHCSGPRPWRQRELSRPVPAVRRIPRRREGRGRPHRHARSAGHRLRGQVRPDQGDARTGRE